MQLKPNGTVSKYYPKEILGYIIKCLLAMQNFVIKNVAHAGTTTIITIMVVICYLCTKVLKETACILENYLNLW